MCADLFDEYNDGPPLYEMPEQVEYRVYQSRTECVLHGKGLSRPSSKDIDRHGDC